MPRSTKVPQPPCLCRRFHVNCSPQTCPQAQHASTGDWNHYTIRAFRESAAGTAQAPPCETCAAVVWALTEVDEIKQILRGSVEDLENRGGEGMCEGAAEDYEMMLIELEAPIYALASPPVPSDEVRVVQTDGELVRYTTLSHRWGNNEEFTLVKKNMAAWSANDIPWDTIPRTYGDAIEVTRKLGVDYIWIDTMCIVQDDADDWRYESTRMKAVYGGSYLNIAAECAAGSHGGLFVSSGLVEEFKTYEVPEGEKGSSTKGNLRIRQQPHFTHNPFGSNYRDSSLLLGRGWVLQERLLAPRVVYYDQHELKWECYGGTDCLCGGMLAISNFSLEHRESLGFSEKKLPIQWMRIVERYSTCLLTFDSDRMIALAGIAEQAYKTGRGGKYLAGLWEQDLAHQLCWQVQDTHRKPTSMYIAPSWSWLSVVGCIWFSNRMDYHCGASEIDVRITQVEVTLADETCETGPVTGGFLKVDGKVVEFDTSIGYPGSSSVPQRFWLTHRETGTTLHYGMEADYIMAEASAKNLETLLLLYWGKIWENRKTFLVLRHAENAKEHAGKYEKLGTYWYIDGEEHDHEFDQLMGWSQHKEGLVII
ncbi:HET domain-containing protein [Microdochium trichocladiopsis]|uniref:HET domain-containing protein n=1 Tax=Microdochium trichocladiopsis TaxID=1682393 RepID=A0A9P8YL38_9PEZI|nr:HET domain-containing protein [Microdochium trichocladiopsis]KAH7041521.1 HET domain-containing protein [Microdochium trichocladiopsis]